MKYLIYLLVFTAVTFGQLLPDYACSDSLTGMFPVYYWQPEDSTLILRWCYGVADTGSYCSLAESDITVPEFVHPTTGVHFLPYDSLDLSQASDELDILILLDRSAATGDARTITVSLSEAVDGLLEDIFDYLDGESGVESCFSGNIRIFFSGYAAPGNYFFYCDPALGGPCWTDNADVADFVFRHLSDEIPDNFKQTGNDPFDAFLWAMDSWDEWFIHGMRPNAERVIFVVTNAPPRSDSLDYLDGSDPLIREKLISFAHGVPETINGISYEPNGAFQVFFVTPPSNFDCSYADARYEGWRDYWDGIYMAYEDWGTEFETGDTANDYYHIPFLYLDPVDSEWVEQDSIDGDLITYRDKVFDFLHHHLVRIWYRPGTGIEEDNTELPYDFSISAYPNPFNSSITISLDFGSESAERLSTIEIFDVNGRLIDVIARPQAAAISSNKGDCFVGQSPSRNDGKGEFVWRPSASLGSGVYLVRAKIGSESVSKRIVYLK